MAIETAVRRPDEMERRLIKVFLTVSVLAFVVCLPLPAFTIVGNGYTYSNPSYEKLISGWLGPFIGVWEWYANPTLLFSWLLLRKKYFVFGAISATASLLVAGAFLVRHSMIINEAGHSGTILSKDIGYWLWIVSIVIALAGNATCFVRARMMPT